MWIIVCWRIIYYCLIRWSDNENIGFEYESIGSIILFFVIATIISYPFSLIAEVLPKVVLSFGKLPKQMAILFYIILDTFATFYGLRVVDYFMQSVSATDISIIIVSLILALFGINDVDKKTKGTD